MPTIILGNPVNVAPISGLSQVSINAGTLVEVSNPGSPNVSGSATMQQIVNLMIAQLLTPGRSRWLPGYGFQFYDTDPAQSAHPWRSQIVVGGDPALEAGIPNIAPVIPVLQTAAYNSGQVNLTFYWNDPTYVGTGNLEVWRDGTAIVTNLSPSATTYSDLSGNIGNVYQVRWNNGTFASALSNPVTAA